MDVNKKSYLRTGKELHYQLFDSVSYDSSARFLFIEGSFTSIDPLAEKYPGVSPYAYCAGDPINHIDPDGESTYVIRQSDGTFVVVGGDENDDDLSVYEGRWEGESFVKERAIGVTPTMTSFYNSDSTAENKWMVGTVIDLNDRSGINFLSGLINDTPALWNYMVNALPGGLYDFKVSNGQIGYTGDKNIYRGMPLGAGIIASARDVGNMGAGYIAGVNGISYEAARFAFDLLESTQHLPTDNYSRPIYHSNDDYPALFYHQECVSTQNAELFGWKMGAFHRNKKKYYGKK